MALPPIFFGTTTVYPIGEVRMTTSRKTIHSNSSVSKTFCQRNGHTHLKDPTLPYPLPFDLSELHRQSLQTLLFMQVHGAPLANPALIANPPRRVLEVGCGHGFWSMMCHQYFKSRGHIGIEFVGMDVAAVALHSTDTPDPDMKWTFVQHDIRDSPWPFADGEFDLVVSKDMALAIPLLNHPLYMDENLRVLRSGGSIEVWETDRQVRLLRPHVPDTSVTGTHAEELDAASNLGVYIINVNTPLSAPVNPFLIDYNRWLSSALEARELMANPCAVMNHYMLQENSLRGVGSHRVAIPFSELRWESEAAGAKMTDVGGSYNEKQLDQRPHQMEERKKLTTEQAALRQTALLTVLQEVQVLESIVREASHKSPEEWEIWLEKMREDLLTEDGASCGECLETGAWWASKK